MTEPAPGPSHAHAHAFVADLAAPTLEPDDRHHLERVLRLRPGEPITVSDGNGSWRPCVFGRQLELAGEVVTDPEPSPPLTVAFALVKGERPEWVVQKLTEVGVDRIVPFAADRSVVRWDVERGAKHVKRLTIVAREAAMQSRRSWLPAVEPVSTFEELAARPGAVRAERDGDAPRLDGPTVVLVGPEGGWSERERQADLPSVALAEAVLRAETAAIAAGVLFVAIRAGLVTVREISR